ncbi:MAG: NfeD family protein [Planctomycetaceae bacterium]
MESYSLWAFLLMALGISLLIAEVFIPSGGLISILAIVSLVAALLCAGKAWWSLSPGYFWSFVSAMVVLLPVAIGVAFYIWPSTPLGKRAILEGPAPEEVAAFVEQEEKYSQMVGQVGETVTALNPAGIVRIAGHRVHCMSEGVIIDAGVRVRVMSAKPNGVIVRPATAEAVSGSGPAPSEPPVGRPLDFDLT